MAIAVVCPGCKKSFRVSDKYAGKKGPCPNCKIQITVPAAATDIKIQGLEAPGGTVAAGATKVDLQPLKRIETKLSAVQASLLIGGALLALIAAWLLSSQLRDVALLRAASTLVVSPPLVLVGYWLLRAEELEPHRGVGLWIRVAICAALYAGLWVAFHFVPASYLADSWQWVYVTPPFFLVGAFAAFACLDLEFGVGFLHYCFYLMATLLLAYLAQIGPFPPIPV